MITFWSLQLMSGQIIAATHDIASDLKGGKFTTATFLKKNVAIRLAAVLWIGQSLSAVLYSITPLWAAFAHVFFGFGIFTGAVHIKFAYPLGFLFDITAMVHKMPLSPVMLGIASTFLLGVSSVAPKKKS